MTISDRRSTDSRYTLGMKLWPKALTKPFLGADSGIPVRLSPHGNADPLAARLD